jgi:hypothetical protein
VRTVVLIGPPGAGKSTVGPLLAGSLGTNFIDVDEIGDAYYVASGRPLTSFVHKVAREGFPSAHRWWQPARVEAATGVVRDHPGAVVAFGAGHSHFEDLDCFESVRSALADCTVVLMIPDADESRSRIILRGRSIDIKGHDWVRDEHDYLAEWVTSEQSQLLADVVAYSAEWTPETYTELIESAIRRQQGTAWQAPTHSG